MDYEDDYRSGQDIEPDSDVDDPDCESQLSQWLGELENYAKGLDAGDTGTVRRRQKTVVTSKMAMESFRYSFLSENQDVNFDAILGELCELEHQLGTAQSELSMAHRGQCLSPGLMKDENRDSGNDLAQSELDALASEITQSLGYNSKHKRALGELDYFHTHYPGDLGGYSDAMLDIAETDSAFSESASLPSSESFTSMATVSSSAENAGMTDGSGQPVGGAISAQGLHCDTICPCKRFANTYTNHSRVDPWHEIAAHHIPAAYQQEHEDQKARIQAEKIRIALEKIKEAKIKKLFVRAFACDGSSKSIMVDEKMTILEVIAILADKNHVRLSPDLAVVEHMPELFMERILEDHDSLVENMVMWTRDTSNKILFESRPQKNDLFKTPERYLLVSSSSEKGASLDPKRRENLIQEFFAGSAAQVPEVEGVLYLKADGKKAWKKYFFVLRASGLYYNPKGKVSKSSKDLACLVQFEFVELYNGLGWKKKYHAPTDYCFALKHPQIQKKTSKFIRYLCAENKAALDQWVMGIRIAKFGKQLLTNFQSLQREILSWDSRDLRTSLSDQSEALAELNQADLGDSRMSLPEPGSRHSIVNVKNSMLVRDPVPGSRNSDEVLCFDIEKLDRTPERKSSLTSSQGHEHVRILDKVPVKRVSFSNTHSVINDSGEEVVPVRHRDSITSASTDSSEDSTSSGEGRMSVSHRGSKLRAKLPVTTGTTKQISEMVQTSMDGVSIGSYEEEVRPNVSSPVQKEFNERRKSAPVCPAGDNYGERRFDGRDHRSLSQAGQYDQLPMSPTSQNPQYQQGKFGSRGIMSPPLQKGQGVKTHSRGSSISSIESSDSGSGQGYIMSPSSPTSSYGSSDYCQSNWPLYEAIDPGQHYKGQPHGQGQIIKQGPPTAQKPCGVKKGRPQSSPGLVQHEKGHKRNSSKSSLESVEEVPRESDIMATCDVPEMPPLSPRTSVMSPPPGSRQGQSLLRPLSQPNTSAMSMSTPPSFSSQNFSHSLPTAMNQSTPSPSQTPASPAAGMDSSYGQIGCMSPRLSGHRVMGPRPMPPQGIPCSTPAPPPLVPPAPRNPAPIKTHKKRPSGGNIVVNGNQIMSRSQGSTYPDIVSSSPRSPSIIATENQTSGSGSPSQVQGHFQGQGNSGSEDTSYAPLPFMAELNKHMHKAPPDISAGHTTVDGRCPPETLPKPCDQKQKLQQNLRSSQNETSPQSVTHNQNHSHPSHFNSADSVNNKQSAHLAKKVLPPPPPKRSGSTKLTTGQTRTSDEPTNTSVPNNIPNPIIDPVYGNCDGIVDINDLPPPPPELLEGYEGHVAEGQGSSVPKPAGKMKPPPPPPPPKRSQLSTNT